MIRYSSSVWRGGTLKSAQKSTEHGNFETLMNIDFIELNYKIYTADYIDNILFNNLICCA
jgi:hypothetical protein